MEISADNYRSAQKNLLVLGKRRSGGSSVSGLDDKICRVGYTVTKKIGCAVIRNKIRRRFKEAVRILLPEFKVAGYDYVIIAGKSCPNASYDDIISDLRYAFKEIRYFHRKYENRKQEPTKSEIVLAGGDIVKNVAETFSLNLDVYGD